MKSYIILTVLTLFMMSCDPQMNCTEPDCGSSPISFQLNASINDTSSIIKLGNTLSFKIQVPDTIDTNNGLYLVEAIDTRVSSIALTLIYIDTIYNNGVGEFSLLNEIIQFEKGGFSSKGPKTAAVYFDEKSKSIQFSLTPAKKGRYYIESSIQSSRFVFKEKDNSWMLVMSKLGIGDIDQHHDLYLSWIPDLAERVATRHALSDRKRAGSFLYAFEVK